MAHADPRASCSRRVALGSIVQRKVVTPNDLTALRELEERLLAFQVRHEQTAKTFQWAFTRLDLANLLTKLKARR
jgi:hypothetical protein